MSKKNRFFITFSFLFSILTISVEGQNKIDSLLQKSFGELLSLTVSQTDFVEIDFYSNILVRKGELLKKERGELIGNLAKCIGYQGLANNRYLQEESLAYADSIIMTIGDVVIQDFPAVAYQLKGDYYFTQKSYKKALENYLLVVSKAQEEKSNVMIFRGKLNIANLKRHIGQPEEALRLHKENLQYIETTKDSITPSEKLITISYIAEIYNKQKEIDSANFYNKYGMQEAIRLKNELYKIAFGLSQGITKYRSREFEIALDSFNKNIPSLRNYENYSKLLPERLSSSYYYAGKSYLELGKKNKAIENFQSIDSIFKIEQNLFPLVRESYEYLIKHYKSRNNKEKQLEYINQLIKVDSIMYADKLFLNRGIVMEYDIPKLKFEKQNIKEEYARDKKQSRIIYSILGFIILSLAIALIIQFRKRQRFKKKFQQILEEKPMATKNITAVKKSDSKKIDIQENVIKEILKGLEVFEKKHGYLSKKITLISLSKKLKTNPNYLSKVINHYKESSFTNYLNTLRVEHSIKKLKTDSTYRKYTVKAIAEEAGFNSVQSFGKAFYNNKGINPSYFVKELEKSMQLSDK